MPRLSLRFVNACLGIAAAATIAAPATARPTAHHKTASRPKARHTETRKADVPHGTVTVPAGGLKVYCPRKSPLLVRKMTQGAGTTVTVLCR